MAGRPKKATVSFESLEACNQGLRDLLHLTVRLEKLQADRDLAMANASAKFEADIDAAKEEKGGIEEALQAWYMANHEAFEDGDRKSVPLYWGVLGRRMPPASLKPLNRSWTWKAIAVKVRALFPGKYFTQPEPALDKDLIKADLSEADLKKCGLKLEQEEDFYYELNRQRASELR